MKINKIFRAQQALILSLLLASKYILTRHLVLFKRTIEHIYHLFFSKLSFQLITVLLIISTYNLQAQIFDEVITYNICAGDTVFVPYAPFPPSILIYPGDCGLPIGPHGGSNLPSKYECQYGEKKITGNEDWICENQSLCFIPQASTEYEIYFPFADDGCCFYDYRVKVIINIQCNSYESQLVDQYPWLNEIIDDNPCRLSSIEVYEDNNEHYILLDLGFGERLFNNQGEIACKEIDDLSCLDELNLTSIVNSWNCDSVSPDITGCTNSNAYNYNPEATVDDDSCINPDLIYTMCEGNQVEIGPFSELSSPPGNCFWDDEDYARNITPSNGLVSSSDDYYIVAPTETTIYTIVTKPPTVLSENCNLPNTIRETVIVEVENCVQTAYYNKNITSCAGDTVLLSNFIEPPLGPDNYGQVIPFCTDMGYSIEPNIGIVSDNYDSFEVAPSETTTYTVTIEYVQLDSSSVCMPSDTHIEVITINVEECTPGLTSDNPYVIESCPGELVRLRGSYVDVPPPPIGVFGDVGGPDFRYVDYSIHGPAGNVCKDCTSASVSPQTTTLYTITWKNGESDLPKDRVSGTRYFLVEVQDCSTEVDLIAPNDSPDIKFHVSPTQLSREGTYDVNVDFYNNGPGYVESVDFIWEINGVIVDTTFYEGSSILAGNTIRATSPDYFFEAETDYTIKVTATNINDGLDLNTQNNVYEYIIPAFEATADLDIKITEPTNPIENSDVVVSISNNGNAYAYNFVINWSVNGNLQTPFTVNDADWNPNWPNAGSLIYKIGSRGFNPDNDYEIVAWVELLNDEVDADLTNNVATFNYSAEDRVYYAADKSITICEGETITLKPPTVYFDLGCFDCWTRFINPVWTLDNDTLNTTNTEITIAPAESGFYNFNTDTHTDCEDRCYYGPGGPDGRDEPDEDYYGPHSYQFGIIVLPCEDMSPVGCTDASATNYNPDAILDDGSCEAGETITICEGKSITIGRNNVSSDYADCYECIHKFINPVWTLGDDTINTTDSRITITPTENGFYNFNSDTDDRVDCDYFDCNDPEDAPDPPDYINYGLYSYQYSIIVSPCDDRGCTDACAPNYNPDATIDDGSCENYDIPDCPDDTCEKYYGWNPQTCACEVIATPDKRCNDGDPCTEDYLDYYCDCVHSQIRGCTTCEDPCAPNFGASEECEDYDIPDCEPDNPSCSRVYYWDADNCRCRFMEKNIVCDDNNECTEDYIDNQSCACIHEQIQGCGTCDDPCAPNFGETEECEFYDIPECGEDTCTKFYYWDDSSCRCRSMEKPVDCDDYNECTEDYLDNRSCQCVNEVIPGCEELCENEPGLMQTASTFVCGGNTFYTREIFSVVDKNSVKAYVLHEEKSFNGIDYILMQDGNRFDSPGQKYNNKRLYISALIGPAGEDGFPKLEDDCTVWTPKGARVVFFDPIAVTIENERCEYGQYFVDVSVNGGLGGISPNFAYTSISDGYREYNNVGTSETITFGPYEDAGSYTIKVKDAKGCSHNFTNTYDCSTLYRVSTSSSRNGSFVITHSNPDAKIKSVEAYSLNGQVINSNASINGSSCRVEILSNKGIYLIRLLLSNNKFDYIKVIK